MGGLPCMGTSPPAMEGGALPLTLGKTLFSRSQFCRLYNEYIHNLLYSFVMRIK